MSVKVVCKVGYIDTIDLLGKDIEEHINASLNGKVVKGVSVSVEKIDPDRVAVCVVVDPIVEELAAEYAMNYLAPKIEEYIKKEVKKRVKSKE